VIDELFVTYEDIDESSNETIEQSPGFVPLSDLDTLLSDGNSTCFLLFDDSAEMDPANKEMATTLNTARIEQVTNEATIILPDLGPLLPPPEDSQIANESQEDRDDSDSANKPAALVKDSRVESVSEGDSMENNAAEFAWTRQHDTLLSRLMLEKLAKRDKRRTRCRQCGHFVQDPSLKHFRGDPGYKVGQARPRSCTVAPSQRREGFPVPPGKRMPPIPRV